MKQATNNAPFHTDSGALILNFGAGLDSTAVLVGLVRRYRDGDETARPDLVIFADTGSEIPETYENAARVDAWLKLNGFPGVTTVSRPSEIKGRAGYKSLEENCLTNETLPGEAFGRGNCSCKWKHEPMDKYLFGGKRPFKAGWLAENGFGDTKPTKMIGYDAEETQSGKRAKNAQLTEDGETKYRYPLIEWGWDRAACEQAILEEGLPIPMKSACFFCPNQRPCELRTLAENHPELFLRALLIEEVARLGKHGLLTIEGLWRKTRKSDGRSGSWVSWARTEGLLETAEAATGTTLAAMLEKAKPALGPEPMVAPFTEEEKAERRKAQAAARKAKAQPATSEPQAPAEPAAALPAATPRQGTAKALVADLMAQHPDATFTALVALAVEAGVKKATAAGALVRLKAAA